MPPEFRGRKSALHPGIIPRRWFRSRGDECICTTRNPDPRRFAAAVTTATTPFHTCSRQGGGGGSTQQRRASRWYTGCSLISASPPLGNLTRDFIRYSNVTSPGED